jgi:hypothetical protein
MTRQSSNTTTITSQTQHPLVGRCEQCGGDVAMVTPEYAVAVLRLPPDKLFGLLASGKLHSLEKPSGILICCGSLPASSAKKGNSNRVGGGSGAEASRSGKAQEAKRDKRSLS